MPHSGENVSRLLGLLYEASASPECWSGFLSAISEYSHADAAAFVLVDPESRCSIVVNPGFDPACQRAYAEYYFQHDELLARFVAASALHGGWVGTSQSVMTNTEYLRSVVFNEFIQPMGQSHQIGVTFNELHGGLEGGLTMLRNARTGSFGRDSAALLKLMAPHLERALNTHHALSLARSQKAELEQSVEALEIAVVSVDRVGRVIRMSSAAQAILRMRSGIVVEGGFLRASLGSERSRLDAMIAGAVATGAGRVDESAMLCTRENAPEAGTDPQWTPSAGGAMVISRCPPSRPLQVMVTPFHSGELLLHDRPAALVFVADPDGMPASRASTLCALYRLTPTECRLTDLLMEGCTLSVCATRMRMAAATARFHLKSIFHKTGTRRQSDLARLVLGLPGKWMG